MKTQNQIILKMLKRGPVTPLMALNEAGCWRLGARIYDLRQQGENIVTDYITHNDKTYASYRLIRKTYW